LLTNISLILGVVGAHPAAGVVRLAGFAGVAGAFSMAAGEYVSMTAQRNSSTASWTLNARHSANPLSRSWLSWWLCASNAASVVRLRRKSPKR
jgi:p-aminobenzoyl-glutamate transporter AbgT